MAVVQNPHIGRSKNAFSTGIFSKWKDKNVLRSKPVSVENPRTLAQRIQRNKFSTVLKMALKPLAVHKAGFNLVMNRMTEVNAAIKYNLQNATEVTTGDNVDLIPANWISSQGSMDKTVCATTAIVLGEATITWPGDPSDYTGDQSETDRFCFFLAEVVNGQVFNAISGIPDITRIDGTYNIVWPYARITGSTFNMYTFFISEDGKKVSGSKYQLVTFTSGG